MAISPTIIWLDQIYTSVTINQSSITTHFFLCKSDPYLIAFRDTDKCLNYIRNLKGEEKIILIISSETLSDAIFLRQCEELPQVDSVYILYLSGIQVTQTVSKTCEIYTDLGSLCNHLKQLPNIRRCRREGFVRDDFIIDIIHYSPNPSALSATISEMISSSNDFANKQHEIDSIYARLLGKILVTVDSTAEEMIEFCRQKCADNKIDLNTIDDFEAYYDACNAIFWYTRDTFLYRLLNKALREQEFNTLYGLRYFIKDLDNQLASHNCDERLSSYVRLSAENVADSSPETIYRGQLMANEDFNKRIRFNAGGFLLVNSFFSTTIHRNLAVVYAGDRSNNETSIEQSVLFQIETSHNYQEYANISKQSVFAEGEEEILFTMGSVFRIVSVNLSDEGFWEVTMRLNTEENFELINIAGRLRHEFVSPSPYLNLGKLMFATANYDKAERFHLLALEELAVSGKYDIIPAVYNSLGIIYNKSGKSEKAIEYYRKSLNAYMEYLSTKDPEFAHVRNNLGMIRREHDDYDKALLYYNEALEIALNSSSMDTSETAIYYNNIGSVRLAQKRYSEALEKFQQCLQLLKKLHAVHHPLLAIPYNNISQVHYALGNYDEANSLLKKTIEIQLRSLPSNHPDLAISCNNLSLVYGKQGQSQKACEMYEKARQIQLKCDLSNRPGIAATYTVVAEFIMSTT
jgi:tetratricopeptide (TPR) repeat protein